jgi:hypothetical protein
MPLTPLPSLSGITAFQDLAFSPSSDNLMHGSPPNPRNTHDSSIFDLTNPFDSYRSLISARRNGSIGEEEEMHAFVGERAEEVPVDPFKGRIRMLSFQDMLEGPD